MSKLLVILGLIAVLVPASAVAYPVSEETVREFQKNLIRHHYRSDVPYCFLPQVVAYANLYNLRHIKANWENLELTFRQKSFCEFKEAGLEMFFWLMLLESGADPNRISPQGAI